MSTEQTPEQTLATSETITSTDVGDLSSLLGSDSATAEQEQTSSNEQVAADQMYWSPSNLSFYVEGIHGEARPSDCVPVSREEHAAVLAKLSAPETVNELAVDADGKPTVKQTAPAIDADTYRKYLDKATSRWADKQARSKGYTDLATACSWATSKIEKFRKEGELFSAWRDALWQDFITKVEAMTDADLKRNADNIETFLDRLVQFNGFKG